MIRVRTSSRPAPVLFIALVSLGLTDRRSQADEPHRPSIRKLGTLDLDMVETTPVVFRDRLYRFEYVRPGYARQQDRRLLLPLHRRGDRQGDPCLRQGRSTWAAPTPRERPCGSSAWTTGTARTSPCSDRMTWSTGSSARR